MSLTSEQIQELLSKPEIGKGKFAIPTIQSGPLRWFDKEMRCATKGCGSSTYCKVKGTSRCMMHALRELNYLLNEIYTELERDNGTG